MCGILGQIDTRQPIDREAFERMLATLSERGPDGQGVRLLNDGRVALGHSRLAIIDLSAAASQPMSNEDGTIWLTFNGEIYNYRELRKELERAGHKFRSDSDSEVIVHGYEAWGDDCVLRLRGIFAFAIWDQDRRRMLLARDHLGVKPLYFTEKPQDFIFASQPRAIVESPTFRRRLDYDSLRDYLAYGNVPHDRAIFKDVQKLPAAHRLIHENGKLRIEQYWRLEYSPTIHDAAEAEARLRDKIAEVVPLQMASDVPIGLFLSGGIDSSMLTALATQHAGQQLSTFTIGFHEAHKDERPFARRVVEHFHTQHYEEVLDYPTATDLIWNLVNAYDEPFALGGAFPLYFVSQLARRHGCKVVLGGDGGDEIFAGYKRYDTFAAQRQAASSGPARLLPNWLRHLTGRQAHPMAGYFLDQGKLTWKKQQTLLRPDIAQQIDPDYLWRMKKFYRPELPPCTAAQMVDVHTYLADEMMTKVDRASMACGVEVRVPLLDVELVELAFQIDHKLIYGTERKAILKRVAAHWLPPEILTARKKGFSSPMNEWIREGFGDWAVAQVREGVLVQRGVFDPAGVVTLTKHEKPIIVWVMLMAELWARRWLEGWTSPELVLPGLEATRSAYRRCDAAHPTARPASSAPVRPHLVQGAKGIER